MLAARLVWPRTAVYAARGGLRPSMDALDEEGWPAGAAAAEERPAGAAAADKPADDLCIDRPYTPAAVPKGSGGST